MKFIALALVIVCPFSAFALDVKHNDNEIELFDSGNSIFKIRIDPNIHGRYEPSSNAEKVEYLDPRAYVYGHCVVINYGNAMYDTDGSESEINLPGNTYVYNLETATLKGEIKSFSVDKFTIINKISSNLKPFKEALLISENEGFIENVYIANADCTIKTKLNIPKWEMSGIIENNGTIYLMLGYSNRILVEIKNEKTVFFHEEKTN